MPNRRNLIIILPHGLRADALGDAHAWPVLTPNLDALSKRGVRLVASSACPADWGGMASLISGLHARQHGLVDQAALPDFPPATPGFPAWLADAGYLVTGVGMVHAIEPWLDVLVKVNPVDCVDSADCAYEKAMRAAGLWKQVQSLRRQRLKYGPFDPARQSIAPDDDVDGFIYNQAKRMLAEMPEDAPWVLIVMFTGPANDLAPPTMFADAVDPSLLEAGFSLADLTKVDVLAELDYPRVQLQRLDPLKLARIRADYLGRVTLIDFGIGRIAAQLAKRRDKDRTYMVVASDHGHLLGEHGLIGHRSFLNSAVQTPVILAPPKPLKQKIYDTGLISSVDLAPTIADIGSCDLPKACVGRSLAPLLRNEPLAAPPGAVAGGLISEYSRRLMLETERFKLIFDTETHQPLAMFDLLNDPDEKKNIIRGGTGMNLLDSLRWRLADALLPLRALPINRS